MQAIFLQVLSIDFELILFEIALVWFQDQQRYDTKQSENQKINADFASTTKSAFLNEKEPTTTHLWSRTLR